MQNIEFQTTDIFKIIDSTLANTLADIVTDNFTKLLIVAKQPVNREILLQTIGLKNLSHNYNTHIKILEQTGWLTMTIPNKPTSPNQQYLTTLKSRLILEFLKHK